MDFSKVATITIEFETLQDLLRRRTGNPIANEEVPEMLRAAIKAGAKVLLTDVLGDDSIELKLDAEGQFRYEPAPNSSFKPTSLRNAT